MEILRLRLQAMKDIKWLPPTFSLPTGSGDAVNNYLRFQNQTQSLQMMLF